LPFANPRKPIIPPFLGGAEFGFGGETLGRGLRGGYRASFFGVALGKRIKNVPLGASFSGFEIRGIPGLGKPVKKFKQPSSDLLNRGFGSKQDFSLLGGKKKNGGVSDVLKGSFVFGGFGKEKKVSPRKARKLLRRSKARFSRLL